MNYSFYYDEFISEKGKRKPKNTRETIIRILARFIVRSGNLDFDIDRLTEIEYEFSRVGNKFHTEAMTYTLDLTEKSTKARKRLLTLIQKDIDLIREIIR
jgi:hypothetical protein